MLRDQMRPVYVATRCPQGSLSLGDRSSASVTEVHDVDGALRVEDPVVKVIPAPPESRRRRSRKSALVLGGHRLASHRDPCHVRLLGLHVAIQDAMGWFFVLRIPDAASQHVSDLSSTPTRGVGG
jgi:hypothetical protein